MGKEYVVDGAKLKCSCGSTSSTFKAPIEHDTYIQGKAQANVKDSRPNINIKPFGSCAARPHHQPCDLKISTPWVAGKNDVKVGDAAALLKTSKLRCCRGGIISVTDSGQTLDKTGAAPIRARRAVSKNTVETEILSIRGIVYLGPNLPGIMNRPIRPEGNGYEIQPAIKPKERIGQWCIVHKDKLPLKEIANRIYHDQIFTGFIADANNVATDYAVKGQAFYLPDINKNVWKMDNGLKLASYSYTGIDFRSIKPIIQVNGDVEAHFMKATFEEYLFEGLNCKYGLVKRQSLSYYAYRGKATKDKEGKRRLELPTSEAGAVKDVRDAVRQGQYVSGRWSNSGKYVWKISKNEGVITRTISWVGGKSFAKTIVKSGLKGMLLTSIIFAGVDAGCDYYNTDGDIYHASYTFGKEAAKGVISGAAGLGASAAVAILIPGVGWAWVVAAGIIFAFGASVGLDIIDEKLQREGIIPR